jgi:CheY-like chemotaxis protein
MTRKLKAVVIDDLDLFRDFLTELLKERGYDVVSYAAPDEFGCGSNGECHCPKEQKDVDLLLTDNRMKPVSGLGLIEQQLHTNCRQLAKNRAVLSGSWTREEKEKAERLGCQTFEKPCNLGTLSAWLDKCEKDY